MEPHRVDKATKATAKGELVRDIAKAATRRTAEDSVSTASAFFSPFLDTALAPSIGWQMTAETMRQTLNLQSLFYNQLVLPESVLLCNPVLRDLLRDESLGYQQALSNGIIVPAVRTSLTPAGAGAGRRDDLDFVQIERHLREVDRMHGMLPAEEGVEYAQMLDRICARRLPLELETMALDFTAQARKLLCDDGKLDELGLGAVKDRLRASLGVDCTQEAQPDLRLNRTKFFDFAQSLVDRAPSDQKIADQALRIRKVSSALYHSVGQEKLRLQAAYPAEFEASIVGLMHRIKLPPLETNESAASLPPPGLRLVEQHKIDLATSIAALNDVDFRYIAYLRNQNPFKKYAKQFQHAITQDPDAAADTFIYAMLEVLPSYVEHLKDALPLETITQYQARNRARRGIIISKYVAWTGEIATTVVGMQSAGLPSGHLPNELGMLTATIGFGALAVSAALGRREQKITEQTVQRARFRELLAANA